MRKGTIRLAELVKVVEFGTLEGVLNCSSVIITVFRDLENNGFFPVVFRRMACRVRPSFVSTYAHEELDLVDPAFKSVRFTGANEREVLDCVMKKVRASIGPRLGRRVVRPRLIELVRTVALGPYDCPGEAPWYFIVKIYKDLEKGRTFFPIVFRREYYRMKSSFSGKSTNEQVDIVVRDFDAERFTRTSERAALAGMVRHIRNRFEPAKRRRGVAS